MKSTFLSLIILIGSISCQSQSNSNTNVSIHDDAKSPQPEIAHKDISIETAKKITLNNGDAIFLDVRTPEEVSAGSIDKSVHIDYNSADFRKKLDELNRDKCYIVYCHAGGRSPKAAAIMKEMGFKVVFNMTEGYRAWK